MLAGLANFFCLLLCLFTLQKVFAVSKNSVSLTTLSVLGVGVWIIGWGYGKVGLRSTGAPNFLGRYKLRPKVRYEETD